MGAARRPVLPDRAPLSAGRRAQHHPRAGAQRGGHLAARGQPARPAHEGLLSTQTFIKLYGQYQHWLSFSPIDQVLLRAELGSTLADSRVGIPEDFLFRAGGSRSNRGYAHQSLGVREGEAVVGGRYLATASAEYIRWFRPPFGAAVFVDVGDANDSRDGWRANPSYGIGARYKTPAGPFALDLAYAQREKRFRLSFSVTVAF
jgi:translocation and assembly module TamA